MILEYKGDLLFDVVLSGSPRLHFNKDGTEHEIISGEWLSWPVVPDLILRYEEVDD